MVSVLQANNDEQLLVESGVAKLEEEVMMKFHTSNGQEHLEAIQFQLNRDYSCSCS